MDKIQSSSSPFVSVIIPVLNDLESLKLCLQALEHQTYNQDFYEVIIVDNNSDKNKKIEEVISAFPKAWLAEETFPSSYAARNKGVMLAQGEILAFTDADCIPAPTWIEKGVQTLLGVPNCGLLAGKIEFFFKNPDQLTFVELYEKFYGFPQQDFINNNRYGATANVFTFKNVFIKVGLFDKNLKSNGDFDWGQRVFLAGYQQIYADDVRIAHPARISFQELYRRNKRLAGGTYDFFRRKQLTFIDFNKLILKTLLIDLSDPFFFSWQVIKDVRVNSIEQKVKISLTRFFIKYVRVLETIRLQLGGISAR